MLNRLLLDGILAVSLGLSAVGLLGCAFELPVLLLNRRELLRLLNRWQRRAEHWRLSGYRYHILLQYYIYYVICYHYILLWCNYFVLLYAS